MFIDSVQKITYFMNVLTILMYMNMYVYKHLIKILSVSNYLINNKWW